MATAYLIHGYIGAGKTTYAQELERQLDAIRFTTDEWIANLYADDEAEIADFGELVRRVESVMNPLWCRCAELGIDVILDTGFWARATRDQARALAAQCGASTRLISLHCPDDVAWARVERRNQELPGNSVRMVRHTFEVLKQRIEPLGEDEDHVLIET